jgi:Ca2+-transporting ATPase
MRLRLEIPQLRHDVRLARTIEASARGRPGILKVAANPYSGRVLIEYARDAPVPAIDVLVRLVRRAKQPRLPRQAQLSGVWHADNIDEVIARLATSAADGLTIAEAMGRLDRLGPNTIAEDKPPSRLAVFAAQLANVPTAMLLGSTIVSLLLGDIIEAGAIVFVIGLNAAIGYRVERHTEDLLAGWRIAEVGTSSVIRGGSLHTAPAGELVPGDVIVVGAGTVITADARVIDGHRLSSDEAPLTGESEPVVKTADPVAPEAPLAQRTAMLYRGTTIASGHGRAVVVATAGATELAKVQHLAAEARAPKGRLQRRLNALTTRLAWSGLTAAAASAVASLAWLRNPIEILRDSVALGVAAIPEGLPVTATAALVRAMARMRERGIVVRRLATAETLGGITVACTDKTGTLTENRMRLEVVSMLAGAQPRRIATSELGGAPGARCDGPIGALLAAVVLNSDLDYQESGNGKLELAGSSTERALVEAARHAGLDPLELRARWPRRRLVERTGSAYYVVSEHDPDVAFIKGAPEQVIPLCALPDDAARAALSENAALASDGLRVLAVGFRPCTGQPVHEPCSWRYLGLVGLRDPLRAGSIDAVHAAARAGIRTIILTGDQRATAEAIARQARIDGDVIEGSELADLLAAPDAATRLQRLGVIARVTPSDKLAVIEALRRHGEVVAMAGDGINDAPALRAADVGIAVGARSSDLARQTADVVLEHADLRAILHAVAEGRGVQDNLRRAIRFQAAGNLGEILLAFGAALAGRRLIPSLGLLWINLLTDTLPGLAIALEPCDGALLDRPPSPPRAPILDRGDWRRVARDGALIAGASMAAAVMGGPLAAFGTIGATQFGYATACRSADQRLGGRFAAMIGGSAALHLVAVASAPARALLRIRGNSPLALFCSGIAMGIPLYAAWRRQADRQITRISSKETSP